MLRLRASTMPSRLGNLRQAALPPCRTRSFGRMATTTTGSSSRTTLPSPEVRHAVVMPSSLLARQGRFSTRVVGTTSFGDASPRGRSFSTAPPVGSPDDDDDDAVVVYESPFGSMVTRLRTVTLMTAVAGTLGLPAVVLFKGTTPTAGFLALCLSFATTSLSTTAAIHYVFSPYVFSIERIPVRKCHSKKKEMSEEDPSSPVEPPVDGKVEAVEATLEPAEEKLTVNTPVLYKAITKSLFLRRVETVFDPAADVAKYKGIMKPLCNLTVRDTTFLFIHTENISDENLKQKLPLETVQDTSAVRNNPDDDLMS